MESVGAESRAGGVSTRSWRISFNAAESAINDEDCEACWRLSEAFEGDSNGFSTIQNSATTCSSKTSVMAMSDTNSRLSGENSIGYALTAHAVACETCMFSHGEPPYADLPGKANCQVFTYEPAS